VTRAVELYRAYWEGRHLARNNGRYVRELEEVWATWVGADYAIACANGTQTLILALMALDIPMGYRVQTTPLTMGATTDAILLNLALPLWSDVHPETWVADCPQGISVSLYGAPAGHCRIDDAAQRPGKHNPDRFFTSYSFQQSKHFNGGEGGMLVTNSRDLADRVRSLGSLGYDLSADRARIDPSLLRSPAVNRHVRVGTNARMADAVALTVLADLERADLVMEARRKAAECYAQAVGHSPLLTPQRGNEAHWAYAVAVNGVEWHSFVAALVRHGAEMPWAAWKLNYHETAFQHLRPPYQLPVAEDLQPRILAFQTNDLEAAERNAGALAVTLKELGG
jgi:perosamine synthetase